ncbi:MAG: PSD1 and planctomycete cytochrome C domain-containing protein [Acidobacteriota bacterium]|nr:PSD1 and planctomycete cytochrome C domain-containing protein [Acidobacteriota bacterium]
MLIYRRWYSGLVLFSLALVAVPGLGQNQSAEAPDFKRDIEPIFSQRCHHCHGPGQASGGLRLDLRESALKGGASGPAIVPGDSSASRLIQMVSGKGGMIMPLQGDPLSAVLIDRLRAWIDEGASWPAETDVAGADLQAGANGHWSFQEISAPAVPATRNPDRVRNPIDSFVLEALETRGLQPSSRASRETLVRRLHLDLLGLPPTPAEVEAFVNDPLPNAYERLVRQLLASPHYGERWARHWLDLARYADSDGFEKDGVRPHAWRYREWVIEAINRDLPYDRFVIEQMAGDLLPDAGIEQRVATGFHRNTLTNREGGVDKEQFRIEQIVDRTNTTASVFLGLTMACAQCHDHKYDPLSQQEYYELFAFLNEAEEKNLPATLEPEMAAYWRAKREWDLRQEMLMGKMEAERTPLEEELAPTLDDWEARNPYPLLGQWQVLDPVSFTTTDSKEAELVKQEDGSLLARGANPAHNNYKVEVRSSLAGITGFRIEALKDPTLPNSGPGRAAQGEFALSEVGIEASTGEEGKEPQELEIDSAVALQELDGFEVARAVDGEEVTGWSPGGLDGPNHNRQIVVILKEDAGSSSGITFHFKLEQRLGDHRTMGRFRLSATTAPRELLQSLVPIDVERVLALEPRDRSDEQTALLLDYAVDQQPRMREWHAALEGHHKAMPQVPETLAQTIAQNPEPPKTHIHVRGDFLRKGRQVMPGTPGVLPPMRWRGERPDRLDLARWIVGPSNPLTGRVEVNRIWEKLFGRGLVATSDDFGTRGEKPSHPELLDWLTREFVNLGWSRKDLIETIVLSSTYQQSSQVDPELLKTDPNNVWLSRQSRFRVESEVTRDLFLAVGGLLERRVGGRSIRPPLPEDVAKVGYSSGVKWPESQGTDKYRRGLYIHFQRTVPYPMLMTFDSPDSNTACIRRTRSNTPLQALTLLNDHVFVDCARSFARKITEVKSTDEDRLRYAFRRALAREPDPVEMSVLTKLLDDQEQVFAAGEGSAAKVAGPGFPGELSQEQAAAWTTVARTILNLDEFVTRE